MSLKNRIDKVGPKVKNSIDLSSTEFKEHAYKIYKESRKSNPIYL
ncbi:hypothetical protein BN2127_JRS10_04043 [Bacillus subtilis]|nr:hypothetical protein BN2127_JRS10_04043 [Bacillus subtilis]